jgi:glycosyltransferase involved in cell wall biosynthesis
MRVALISAYYPSHGGGMELACAELAQVLLAAGIEVVWIAQADKSGEPELGALVSPVPGTDIIYDLSGVPMPLPMPWAAWTVSREVGRSDLVIVAEANFALSAIAYWIARIRGKKVMLVQHVGRPSTLSALARRVMTLGERLVVRPIVRGADLVVCVSPVVARHFSGMRTKGRLLTINHGIDVDRFRPSRSSDERAQDRASLGLPQAQKAVCYLGRLTESKGLLVVRELARARKDWIVAIAGSGPIDPAQWELPNVRVLGQLDRDEAAKLLRASDALVLPSQSESFSLVVREALAAECKVVCSDQILETDPGLAPYLITRPVDLTRHSETAADFASALDRPPDRPPADARAYIERVCSSAPIGAQYLRLVEGLAASSEDRGR